MRAAIQNRDTRFPTEVESGFSSKSRYIAFFLLFGMTFSFIHFAQTLRKPGRHVVTSVCSHASQKYPGILLDREPIRAREKRYSLVWYMLIVNVLLCSVNAELKHKTADSHASLVD